MTDLTSIPPVDCFEFHRRVDGVVYRFEPAPPRQENPAWKRVDADLWLTMIAGKGWRVIDADGNVTSQPWDVAGANLGSAPPEGEWVSKKGDKSYVYDLVRVSGPVTTMGRND